MSTDYKDLPNEDRDRLQRAVSQLVIDQPILGLIALEVIERATFTVPVGPDDVLAEGVRRLAIHELRWRNFYENR